MAVRFFRSKEQEAPPRRLAADLRRHRGPLRRPLSRAARRRRPRRPRPRGRARPVRPQDPQDPDHPHGPQLHHGGGSAPPLRRLGQRRRLRPRRARAPRRSGPSTSTATSPAAACTGGRAPGWPSSWAGGSSTRACPASAAATRSSGRTSPWRTWPTRSWRSCTRSTPGRPSCSATPWAAPWPCSSPTTIRGAPSGSIYRDGVSTPAWKERSGLIPTLLSPILPDVAPMVDMIAAVFLDLPDLAIGRMYSTVRAVLPDMRQNIRTMSQTMPVGSMLMSVDQRSEVRALVAQQIPILNEWGCFDRITPGPHRAGVRRPSPARPCCGCPGATAGCWPAPRARADILTHLAPGREFMSPGGEPLAPAHPTRVHAARRQLTLAVRRPRAACAGAPVRGAP